MEENIEKCKDFLKKSYNQNRKKLYPFLKSMSDCEKEIVLSDKDVLERLIAINDDEILSLIFRTSPAKIQEIIWQNENCQKRLLTIKNLDFQDRKSLNNNTYFSKERLRRIKIFFSEIKSPLIIGSLTSNIYFQIIVLFSKNFPRNIIEGIDALKLYENTITSGVYNLANIKNKNRWVSFLNGFFEEVKLPDDFREVYNYSEKESYHYYDKERNTIIPMIRSKCYHMKEKGKKVIINKDTLNRISMKELIALYDLVSERPEEFTINKENIEEYFKTIIDEHINNETIFQSEYFDLSLISHPFQFFVFTKVKEATQTNKKLETQMLGLLFDKLFKSKTDYTDEEINMIDIYIKNSVLNSDKDSLSNLFSYSTAMKSAFHMKFNKTARNVGYLEGFDIHKLFKLNVKQVNKIAKLLEDKTQDEISDTYSKAIKLYFVFGLDRSVAILNGEYGKVNKAFLDCVSKLNIDNAQLKQIGKKYEPILNQEFINFLFTGNNIFELFRGGSAFETTWFYLFNNFEEIKEVCKGHITIKQAEIVMKEQMNNVKYEVPPDLYSLEEYLYEIGLGNKTKKTNEEVYDEVVNIYKQQLQRKTSSIPYVRGSSNNGYQYEVMRMDDAIAYVLGYRANCCIRVLDIAHNHLLHALLCENGRILLAYSETGALMSFSPIKRNGELLIANSIEVIGDKDNKDIVAAFSDGIKAIMSETRRCEDKGYLKVACIGSEAYLKPIGQAWPSYLPTPTILEKDEELYKRTDQYHKKLDVIAQEEGFDLKNLKLGPVKARYKDKRHPIKSCKFSEEAVSIEKIEVEKIVNSVDYINTSEENKKSFRKKRIYYMSYAFYNEDWYILIDKIGKFYYGVVEGSEEALKEMQATLAVLSNMKEKQEIESYILSFKKM